MRNLILLWVFLVAGCATVNNDLSTANSNLQGAIAAGKLPANDPLAACIAQWAPCVPSATQSCPPAFSPKADGVLSAATVVYIGAVELQNSPATSAACDQQLGAAVRKAATQGALTTLIVH
jgi:hypothetical protein